MNRRAGKLAAEARDNTESDVLIAGSLPPFYGSFRPDLVKSFEVIEPMYREQAEILSDYVDFFLCETMSSAAEAVAAVSGAQAVGKPIWIAWTLEDGGSAKLRSGETVTDAHAALDGLPVSAYLVNCCAPESVTAAMPELAGLTARPVGGFANWFAEIPDDWESGDGIEALGQRHDLDPDAYAGHVTDWLAAGARIVGGCCEIGPKHIARLRHVLDAP
ncbi:MAG: homocysteine S-methyltransferase family protein [Magnetovibrio sp.]|nr:homocysteine S-methyltransferase family protein [Magnetovibrio sp.]